jgi:hypothetical protein
MQAVVGKTINAIQAHRVRPSPIASLKPVFFEGVHSRAASDLAHGRIPVRHRRTGDCI